MLVLLCADVVRSLCRRVADVCVRVRLFSCAQVVVVMAGAPRGSAMTSESRRVHAGGGVSKTGDVGEDEAKCELFGSSVTGGERTAGEEGLSGGSAAGQTGRDPILLGSTPRR